MSFSPLVGGNVFSLAFGKNLDAHTPTVENLQCLEGRECYVASLHMTIASTFVAFVLAVWAGHRDHRKKASNARVLVVAGDRND